MTRRLTLALAALFVLALVATASAAVFGKAQTLTGLTGSEKVSIRPYKIAGFTASLPAARGKVWIGVFLQMKNVGTKVYTDSPLTDAALLTSKHVTVKGSLSIGGACKNPATVKLAPGKSIDTCVAFQGPRGAKYSTFTFKLDSGFASKGGTWTKVQG